MEDPTNMTEHGLLNEYRKLTQAIERCQKRRKAIDMEIEDRKRRKNEHNSWEDGPHADNH